jgi:hypothetical protein
LGAVSIKVLFVPVEGTGCAIDNEDGARFLGSGPSSEGRIWEAMTATSAVADSSKISNRAEEGLATTWRACSCAAATTGQGADPRKPKSQSRPV